MRGRCPVKGGIYVLGLHMTPQDAPTADIHTPTRQFRLADEMFFRTYTAEQFQYLLDRSDVFEVVQTYDFAYDAKKPIDIDGDTEDVIYVLCRK